WTTGRPARRYASTSETRPGTTARVPATGVLPPSAKSTCVSITSRADVPQCGARNGSTPSSRVAAAVVVIALLRRVQMVPSPVAGPTPGGGPTARGGGGGVRDRGSPGGRPRIEAGWSIARAAAPSSRRATTVRSACGAALGTHGRADTSRRLRQGLLRRPACVSVRRCPRYSRSDRHLPPTTARAPSSPCLRQRAALPSVLAVGQTPPADYGKGSFVALPASACGAALGVVGVLLLPREQRAQLLADLLDRVLRGLLAERGELRRAGVLVVDEALGERAGLDVREDALHVLLDVRVDHARARDVVAVLRGVGDGPALLGDAALPHEVDDELELVQHLEVRDLRLVAGLGEGLEAVLDELRHATAQDGLLAEEVGLGLLGERRPDDAGARAADRLRVRQ